MHIDIDNTHHATTEETTAPEESSRLLQNHITDILFKNLL